MNTKILDQLEFNKVKDQFTEYLQTEQAQAELRDLVPMTNPERIQNQFTEIQEMAEILGAMLLRQLNFAPGPA